MDTTAGLAFTHFYCEDCERLVPIAGEHAAEIAMHVGHRARYTRVVPTPVAAKADDMDVRLSIDQRAVFIDGVDVLRQLADNLSHEPERDMLLELTARLVENGVGLELMVRLPGFVVRDDA